MKASHSSLGMGRDLWLPPFQCNEDILYQESPYFHLNDPNMDQDKGILRLRNPNGSKPSLVTLSTLVLFSDSLSGDEDISMISPSVGGKHVGE